MRVRKALGLLLAGTLASAVPVADEAPRPHTYMAFGDSITEGAGSGDELGYRPRLEAALRDRFGEATVINEGKPAADSRRGQHSISAALRRHRPAATLILLGTNDWDDTPREPASTANALRRIVREVKARHSRPYLATIPPTNTGFDANVPPARGAVLVDLHAAFVSAGAPAALFADGVHPNDAGYAVIATAFFEALTGGER
jgi:lysophospholipase L1-like esterase